MSASGAPLPRLTLVWLFVACTRDDPKPVDSGNRCEIESHTWETVGKPVLLAWCTPCHSSALSGELRQGAPPGVDFDTYAGVLSWADRIAVRAGGTEPTMPPGGGVSDEDRDALVTWIECGLPGGSTPLVDPCDAPALRGGDALASASLCSDGSAIAVEGALTIDAPADVSCVCSVGGDLIARADAEMPALRTIGGVLRAEGAIASFAAPALTDVGTIEVLGPPGLRTLDVKALVSVAGPLHLSGIGVETVGLSSLRSVGGELQIEDLSGAHTIDLPRLEDIGGDLVLRRMEALSTLGGTLGIETVLGSVRLEDLPALANLDRFGSLVTVGDDIALVRVGAATLSAFDRVKVVPGDVWLEDLDTLEISVALPDLETVGGSLVVLDNGALVEWLSLPWLAVVGGDLRFERNGSLKRLPPFGSLLSVGGDLRVVDNPLLPSSDALDLSGRISVGGEVAISGNAP